MKIKTYEKIEALESFMEDFLILEMEYGVVNHFYEDRLKNLEGLKNSKGFKDFYYILRRSALDWIIWTIKSKNVAQNNRQYFHNRLCKELGDEIEND